MNNDSGADPAADDVRRTLRADDGVECVVTRFDPGKPVYLVQLDDGRRWVARTGRGLARYVAVLDRLARVGVPAARVIRDGEGRALRPGTGDDEVLVLSYVPGTEPTFVPDALARVGAALGRLHASAPALLDPVDDPAFPSRAGMLPGNELAFAGRRLAAVADQVTSRDRALYDELVGRCAELRSADYGPTTVLLHGDCHPWNAITDGESTTLVDWDSAGPGPAVIDLAFLALSADTGGLIWPVADPDLTRLEAVVDRYAEQVRLTVDDHRALPRAVEFRVLVGVGVGVAHWIAAGTDPREEEGVAAGLERLRRAPDVAARIRARLEAAAR